MKRVGSSNKKFYHQDEEDNGRGTKSQLSHHARSLSMSDLHEPAITTSTIRERSVSDILHYSIADLHMESLKPATWPELRNYRRSFAYIDLQPEFYKKPPSACKPRTARQGSPLQCSTTSSPPAMKTKEESDDESGYGSPGRKSALSVSESAALQRMKQRGPHTPMSPNQILLKVSTIQNLQKTDAVGSNMDYNARIRDKWGISLSGKEQKPIVSPSLRTESQNNDPLTLLQHLKSSAVPVDMRTVLTAFEIRKVGLKVRASLHNPEINSTIPCPIIIRPQTSYDYRKKENRNSVHRRSTSALDASVKQIGLYTSCDSVQPMRMIMGQNIKINIPKRKVPDQVVTADPYRNHSGFQLLTLKQLKAFQAEKTSRQKEADDREQAAKNKESKKAWLKKIKGKNIDVFTKEGKIAAPEFGPDVFL